MANRRTAAFDVDQVRREIFRNVRIPVDLLTKAFKKIDDQLDAKETKFFTHQGKVEEQVNVEAHDIQHRAALAILKVSELTNSDREHKSSTRPIELRIDPITGAFSIRVGGDGLPEGEMEVPHAALEVQNAPIDINHSSERPDKLALEAKASIEESNEDTSFDANEPQVQVVKVRQGGLPNEVFKALFSE